MVEITPEDMKLVDVLETISDTEKSILISMKLILIVMEEILKRLDGTVIAEA